MLKGTATIICMLALFCTLALQSYGSSDMQGERPRSPIVVNTDKTDYYTGEIVKIIGSVPALENGHEVNIIVKDANGGTFTKLRVKPDSDRNFTASFQIPSYDKLFPTGKWAIKIGYAIWATKVDINILADEKKSLYPIAISEPMFTAHTPIRDSMVGDEVFIITEVNNNTPNAESFFYLVLIRDGFGLTALLDWTEGSLPPNEARRASILWVPEQSGKYQAEVFFWSDLNKPSPLSESRKSFQITIIQ